jgi:predicted ATP-dependent protease
VLIPGANRAHLVLRDDVADAISAGRFHIYAVDRATQGIEVLTGLPAGERDAHGRFPAASVFGRVERRIIEIAERLRDAEGHPGHEVSDGRDDSARSDALEGSSARRH